MHISHSLFFRIDSNEDSDVYRDGLHVDMHCNASSNVTALINNNVFMHTPIVFECGNDCSQESIKFTNNTLHSSTLWFRHCGYKVIIKDVVFSGLGVLEISNIPEIWFVNCTFENISALSAITAFTSNLYFEGKILFSNSTSLIGGAIALH